MIFTTGLLLALFAFIYAEEPPVTVVGNLAVVAYPLTHVGTPDTVLMAKINNLWCGTQKLGEDVHVEYGEFTRLKDGKVFAGTVQGGKVYLEVGEAPVTVAGKYRCEVRTVDKKLHTGNLIIYLPPVLIFDKSVKTTQLPDNKPPLVKGPERRGLEGETMTLECPVYSYPESMARWEFKNEPIAPSENVTYDGNSLILSSLNQQHVGSYRCIADNTFPLFVDGPLVPHQLYYDQEVRIL